MPFGGLFAKTDFELVGPDGSVRANGKAQFDGGTIMIWDANLQIFTGDEIRRRLPSGADEAFEVVDPQFFDGFGAISPHYEVKVRRKGTYPHGSGGNYSITVTGENARVNLHSTDNSTNTVNNSGVFADLIGAIEGSVQDASEKAVLIEGVKEMEKAKGTNGFAAAYSKFVGAAANHIAVITPFLPALSGFLAG